MKNVKDFDSYRSAEEIIRQRYKSNKFIICVLDEKEDCLTYISEEVSQKDACWMIDCINEVRSYREY